MLFREDSDDSLSVYANGVLLDTFRYFFPLVENEAFDFLTNEKASVELTTVKHNKTIYYPPYIKVSISSPPPSVTRSIQLTQGDPVYSIDFSDNYASFWNISVQNTYTLDVHVALDEQYNADLEKFKLYDGTTYIGK